ncbi:GNAT family N-acetyltransferase [Olsenella urininfantis]|uniref:GNAT family N-acetyltransferase n=1 Tax=Olsenella urininfantis TaxID=1871033 RepID=UPI0009846ABD|nr:GNAT family N-acetyltransferase [Olsenella urininfantis]
MIETERLALRPWQEEDVEALFRHASHPHVGPAAGWPAHQDMEESRHVLHELLMVDETYAITAQATLANELGVPAGEALGSVSLKRGEASKGFVGADEAELGFWLARPAWGRSIMPEACEALLEHAFVDLGLRAVWAASFSDNLQSQRVQEKLGMRDHHRQEGVYLRLLDTTVDERVMRITRSEWLRRR